jgi:flagellar hook-associated protein 2
MGSVGLSFGSPTSGQGFDVTTTVSSIVSGLQAVETPWKNQLTSLQSQDTALTSIGTDLSSLSTAAQSLTDFEGVLTAKQGSSSDTDVLSLTSAGTTAVAGSHTVVVRLLASTAA